MLFCRKVQISGATVVTLTFQKRVWFNISISNSYILILSSKPRMNRPQNEEKFPPLENYLKIWNDHIQATLPTPAFTKFGPIFVRAPTTGTVDLWFPGSLLSTGVSLLKGLPALTWGRGKLPGNSFQGTQPIPGNVNMELILTSFSWTSVIWHVSIHSKRIL